MDKNWKYFYNELANKIVNFSWKEILNLTLEIENETWVNSNLWKDRVKIQCFDNFSFFANFNRRINSENRIKILEYLKNKFNLKNKVPTQFNWIPWVNNLQSWFFGWKEKDVEILDELFYRVLENKDLWDLFDKALKIDNCALTKLTSWLYWINADNFLPLDQFTLKYIEKELNQRFNKKDIDYNKYLQILKDVKNNIWDDFVEITYKAGEQWEEIQKEDLLFNIIQEIKRNHFFNDINIWTSNKTYFQLWFKWFDKINYYWAHFEVIKRKNKFKNRIFIR